MSTHRLATISILALGALAGCSGGAAGGEPEGDAVAKQSSADTALPSDPNWAPGFSSDAVRVGTDGDGSPLYACRAAVGSSIQPGKMRKEWGACDIGYGGRELSIGTYQTLVPTWTAATYGAVPPNASPFGYDSDSAPLFVCRGYYAGSLQTGKAKAGLGCLFPYGGQEISVPAYEVLTNTSAFAVGATTLTPGAPLPANAIAGGTDGSGAPLYLCVAPIAGSLAPGKMQASWGGCNVSYGGREYSISSPYYQVLVPQFNAPPLNVATHPYVAGTDANGTPLGICNAAYGGGVQVGKYMSNGVCDFGYGGQEVGLTSGFGVFSNYQDASPITYDFGSITFPSGVALGGWARLTLNPDGSYVFSGHFHDSGSVAYDESTIVAVKSASGTAFTFSRSGSSYGTFESGSRDDDWNITGNNPAIAAAWGDLKKGAAWGVQAQQTSSVSLDIASMWSSLKQDFGYVSQVIAIVGSL